MHNQDIRVHPKLMSDLKCPVLARARGSDIGIWNSNIQWRLGM